MILHQCFHELYIVLRKKDPAPNQKKKWCRCRQYVNDAQAEALLATNLATRIVVKRAIVEVQRVCTLCAGDKTMKNCAQCRGAGTVPKLEIVDEYGEDLVASDLARQTPRVATIEKSHIQRAYTGSDARRAEEERERIEAYGLSILENRAFIGPNKIPMIGVEPPDDPKTGTGRRYDYGRAIIIK